MNLERFIYEFNLASTMAVKDNVEWGYVLNNGIDKEIDYENSVSFYHFVESFNKLYLKFKNDFNKLDKWSLGEDIQVLDVYSNEDENDLYRSLVIYIDNPDSKICDYDETLLYIIEKNGEIYGRITNNLNYFDKNYYNRKIDIDKDKASKYLDFFLKYKLFLDAFDFFRNTTIFGNGTTCLFSKINGELLEVLSTFELAFGNAFFNTSDYINVVFKLGENLEIDYDKSKVILRLEELENKKEVIDEMIHNLYISKSKLSKIYCDENVKKLVK